MQKYRESFAVSELGRIYAQLPLKEIAEKIRSQFHKRIIKETFRCSRRREKVALMWGCLTSELHPKS